MAASWHPPLRQRKESPQRSGAPPLGKAFRNASLGRQDHVSPPLRRPSPVSALPSCRRRRHIAWNRRPRQSKAAPCQRPSATPCISGSSGQRASGSAPQSPPVESRASACAAGARSRRAGRPLWRCIEASVLDIAPHALLGVLPVPAQIFLAGGCLSLRMRQRVSYVHHRAPPCRQSGRPRYPARRVPLRAAPPSRPDDRRGTGRYPRRPVRPADAPGSRLRPC